MIQGILNIKGAAVLACATLLLSGCFSDSGDGNTAQVPNNQSLIGNASISDGSPTPLAASQTAQISVAVETDVNDLNFTWTTTTGTLQFASTTGNTNAFTAPNCGSGAATVAVTATSNTSSTTDTASFTIQWSTSVACTSGTSNGSGNAIPVIQFVTRAPQGNPISDKQRVFLNVSATDADDDALTYHWSSDQGFFDDQSTAETVWVAPAGSGQAFITVTVSDLKDSVSQTLNISWQFNNAPVINSLTRNPTAANDPVNSSTTVLLDVDVTDADGHPLTYTWTATAGTFNNPNSPSPTWTSPATGSGTANLVVIVSDGGKSVEGQLNIGFVRDGAPQISGINRNPNPMFVNNNDTIQLTAQAVDPEGGPLTYSWTATEGTLNPTTGNPVDWTAPGLQIGSAIITVTVTDAQNNSSFLDTTIEYGNDHPKITRTARTPKNDPVPLSSTVSIDLEATDRENDPLTYSWSSNVGTFNDPSLEDPVWTAPASGSGTARLRIDVFDTQNNSATTFIEVDYQ